MPFDVRCPECSRVFDLFDDTDADEWAYGHDCERTPTAMTYEREALRPEEVRYDSIEIRMHRRSANQAFEQPVIIVDAAAESTRYHLLCVLTDEGWWIMCENLSTPVALPILPHLFDWHHSYLRQWFVNDRAAQAVSHILNHVHQRYVELLGLAVST